MRVTNRMMVSSTLTDLNGSLERLQRSQTRLSTGRVITKPSDDPAGTSSAMKMRQQLRRSDQHARVITDTEAMLRTADAAIVNGLDLMSRVKELAVEAANIGASGGTTRMALSAELTSLRDGLLAVANTQYLNRSLFNGTADGKAYDPTGVYLGNDATVVREVGPNTTIQANVTGPEVFGDATAPEGDLFAMLDRLEAAILADDMAGVAAEHENLDVARQNMASAAAQIGVRGARLQSIEDRRTADEVVMREALAQIEDADIAEALISVKTNENAYQAALQAAGRVLPPSLLDYMR